MFCARRNTARGLTLLEVVISISLITMLMSALLTFFWQSVELREQAARVADRTELARQVSPSHDLGLQLVYTDAARVGSRIPCRGAGAIFEVQQARPP